MTIRNLDALFHPRSIAVIGGSSRAGSLGERVLENIIDGGFEGLIFAVNPKRVELDKTWWVHSIDALPEAPDLAIIVTPADTIPGIIGELGAKGIKVAVVLSAGLQDPALRDAMLAAARPHLLRIVGPNCLGVLLPHARLNASFAPRSAAPGRLAFVSQSGALVTAMLDWAADKHVGFSAVVSAGDMADVDLGDLIDMLAGDPATDAILLYVEGVTAPAKFMSAARAASRVKPVIAIKAGRSAAAGKAAISHTGALVGDYDVHAAAFARAGIVLVDSLTDLFDAAQVLCRHRPQGGDRLAIVTNGGGAGVLAADALADQHRTLATLSPQTVAALEPVLPHAWSRGNPIDVVGDARAERFSAAAEAALADPGVDALLVIHCPTAVATGTEIAAALATAVKTSNPARKPVIACWMGSANADASRAIFDDAGIPLFDNLDDAVRGFGYLRRAHLGQEALLRAPARVSIAAADKACATAAIASARPEGRTILNATEAKVLLAAYGVPINAIRFAQTPDAVAAAAADLAPPYAVKLVSPQLPHKSDVGGVRLDLATGEDAVQAAREMAARIRHSHPEASISGFEVETMVPIGDGQELLAGFANDPTFGPVLAFGAGGKAVEVVADRALGLPPLDDRLAEDMIDATRIGRLLKGYRDVPPADRAAIVRVLNALSAIAVDFPEIAELEINPLVATAEGVIALDARGRLFGDDRRSQLAIRPVPVEWTADLTTSSGLALHVRPVVPEDEALLADLFAHVSREDLRFRFLSGRESVGRDQLVPMCQVDYARTINFLAFAGNLIVASAMLATDPDHRRAELALAVREDCKGKGVSWTLVEHVMRYAAAEGIETVESLESRDNRAALALEREMGFETVPTADDASEVLVRRRVTMH
ncbi:bifunctional acetate--CoA ligase family protein/GNAT family N-acetyltransferase [Sphingomonas cannabina]|uniref:bifunctional acetate--CoA ligase family protein/GNAT family N-acetyltransferase n=1 Tax=Sphingomonas cannabina TaxID=2899123 RepID=UPI001F16D3A9|nr:bifunctional acetate--CoA ligase family protein/GNAT family N-acetyltransferase [Sphingomonas cannabina]UIJ46322.1 bifunctional acetate--CoA ligase family protein/GNAT family N-acetyltransferase [Sphingomonas cannabina]